jgi:hypothetical protein
MAEKWNFHMSPPETWHYSSSQVNEELVHSIKAFNACGSVAKALADCRRKPEGAIARPEKCQNHALALVECYQAVKTVPANCTQAFFNTTNCLNSNGSCGILMDAYVGCEHPASKVYENYH